MNLSLSYQNWKKEWKTVAKEPSFWIAMLWSFVVLLASMFAANFANTYATLQAGLPVQDAILSHIPTMHVFGLYAYGVVVMGIIFLGVLIRYPASMPLALKGLGVVWLVRSISVCLTHLGFPPGIYIPEHAPAVLKHYFLGGDLFFSGHVAIPLMVALVFWRRRAVRIFFVGCSVLLGFTVLAGHFHYSIDVFTGILITPTLYMMLCELFPYDFLLEERNFKS
jgi:PAP2 superfamily protein